MFRQMRRKKQQLDREECVKILTQATSGVLAVLGDDGYPYAVPLSFAYCDGHIYFHCAKSGHKLDAIAREEKASFCVIHKDQVVSREYTTYFKSVIAFGRVRRLDSQEEKWAGIEKLALKYAPLDSRENREQAILKEFPPLCVLEMRIEHLTGKQAIEQGGKWGGHMLLEQELLALGIERAQAEKMAAYGARLEEVNQSFNLTRITSPKEMAQKHFYDSLAPVRLGVLQPGQRVLDIGTGAGFPGVPLAIAGLKVTMLDSSEKKIGFVRKSCEALGISAQCIWGRAEELAHLWQNEPLDAVVARAVARLPMLLELGSAFIKTGGLFVAYKGEAAQEEAEEARSAAKTLNMRLEKILPAGLSGREHQLVIYKKLGQTPKGYPRKFAKIKARPL